MKCEDPECKLEMINKIKDVQNCAGKKVNKLHFGWVIGCLMVIVGSAFVSGAYKIAKCADKDAVSAMDKRQMIYMADMKVLVQRIEDSVAHNNMVVMNYIRRTEVRDDRQDVSIKKEEEKRDECIKGINEKLNKMEGKMIRLHRDYNGGTIRN